MGYITQANTMAESATEVLSKLYKSSFTQYLQGLGQPVLVTWYNFNDTFSTTDAGLGTVDALIGPNSPIKYNKIINTPVYGMNRDMNPDMEQGEGDLIDLNIEMEITVLPNTFKPSPYDLILYEFGDHKERKILFRVNNVQISSIKSNSFYKVNIHAYEIDDDEYVRKVEACQVTKTFTVDLDRIGTNEKCLIEDTMLSKYRNVDKLIYDIIQDYQDLFYDERYNSIILRNGFGNNTLYDPYVTNFLVTHGIMEYAKRPLTLVTLDTDYRFRNEYNLTFYRAIETKDIKDINQQVYYQPTNFTRKNVNPFAYYGDEVVYKLTVYDDKASYSDTHKYQNYKFIANILHNEPLIGRSPLETCIVNYFINNDKLSIFSESDLEWLGNYRLNYNMYDFQIIPIVIYILMVFKDAIGDSYS